MDLPRGFRSADKATLLEIAWHLAGKDPAILAQACRSVGASDVAAKIKVPTRLLSVRQQGSQWIIEGDSFPVKDVLKRRGARWNGMADAWAFDARQDAQAAIEEATPILAMRQELAAFE